MMTEPITPATIAIAEFSITRKGFDQHEVKRYLESTSFEFARLRDRESDLSQTIVRLEAEVADVRKELAAAREQLATSRHMRSDELDEATVAALLGEEAARVLTTARDAASRIRSKAQTEADEAVRTAVSESERMRTEANAEADRVRAAAQGDADATRTAAEGDADNIRESVRNEGRHMALEARAYRERVASRPCATS